jgi:integrase
MRRPHRVPLPRQALEHLKHLERLRAQSPLVFPSSRNWRKAISENTLNVAIRRLGFDREQMTAHGFRASFSTIANESGKWHALSCQNLNLP